MDYHEAWKEFNVFEICVMLASHNYTTAIDINMQNDLIDITARLLAGKSTVNLTVNLINRNVFDFVNTSINFKK